MSEVKFTLKIQDNSGIVKAQCDDAVDRALFAMGVKAVEGAVNSISGKYTASNKAVDTGRLRASISFITADGKSGDSGSPAPPNAQSDDKLHGNADKSSVIVGSNVNYAEYVHDGTHGKDGRPFLREGIDRVKDDMKKQVERIFKGEM